MQSAPSGKVSAEVSDMFKGNHTGKSYLFALVVSISYAVSASKVLMHACLRREVYYRAPGTSKDI